KVAAPVVKIDHIIQRRFAAVMEVGRCQLDVAQTGGLEGAVVFWGAALREGRAVRAQGGPPRILRGRAHPVIVEALVAAVFVDQPLLCGEAERGVRQLCSCVARGALALAAEDVEPELLTARE